MKRFWDQAGVVPGDAGWLVQLDGRPLRVPGGGPLILGTRVLAEAVAAEWRRAGGTKGGETSYADLPLTRLAGTAQERIGPDPEPVALEIARYAQADLLCYRATGPAALVHRQSALWQPWLDWGRSAYGAELRVTSGVVHVPQPPEVLARLAAAVRGQPLAALAGLGVAVPALGSVVLGLAVAEGALDAATAFDLSVVDETFQAELWGDDAEAAARRGRVRGDVATAGRYMALARA